MRHFKFATVVLAAIAMFSSCTRNVGGGGENEASDVVVGISFPTQPRTRAEGDKFTTGDNKVATLTSGHIFFYSSTGLIDKHVGVGTTTGGNYQVLVTDLKENKVVVHNVSGNANLCAVIFNDHLNITSDLTGTHINDVLSRAVAVGDINNAAGDIENVPLLGKDAAVTSTTPGDVEGVPYTKKVHVDVAAIGTRLQIGKVSSAKYTPAGGSDASAYNITDFTVQGIYINYVNSQMTMAGTAAIAPEISNGQVIANYSTTAPGTYVSTGVSGKLADALNRAASGTPLNVAPATKTVWAYNLFPTQIPHIIVRFSEVKYRVGDTGDVQTLTDKFLTLSKFRFRAAGNGHTADQDVAAFMANNIYTINDIVFDYADLTDLPETESANVLVEIDMMPWVDNEIYWNN